MQVGELFLEVLASGVITPAELSLVTAEQQRFSRLEEATALRLGPCWMPVSSSSAAGSPPDDRLNRILPLSSRWQPESPRSFGEPGWWAALWGVPIPLSHGHPKSARGCAASSSPRESLRKRLSAERSSAPPQSRCSWQPSASARSWCQTRPRTAPEVSGRAVAIDQLLGLNGSRGIHRQSQSLRFPTAAGLGHILEQRSLESAALT